MSNANRPPGLVPATNPSLPDSDLDICEYFRQQMEGNPESYPELARLHLEGCEPCREWEKRKRGQ